MRILARVSLAAALTFATSATALSTRALGRPATLQPTVTVGKPNVANSIQRTRPSTAAVVDTVWIAEWTFDAGGACDDTGWQVIDNRILNDGSNYWDVEDGFDGTGGITGQAAILSRHDLCLPGPDGYGNNWDYAIVCKYVGTGATLSFDYLLDSETGYDSLTIEADELCSSNDIDYDVDPGATPSTRRQFLYGDTGVNASGSVAAVALPSFGAPTDTHCVYIRFHSDETASHADGGWPVTLPAALVVDNIVVTGGLTYTESFEAGALGPHVTFINAAPNQPFGTWARLYAQPTDNNICSENTTCAWIFSDPALPAYTPEMGFGPGGAVVRNWLDNVILSPWVTVPTVAYGVGTVVEFLEFPGNKFDTGRIVRNWSLRGKSRVDNTDTATPGDSLDCVSEWVHATSWTTLDAFEWTARSWELDDWDSTWRDAQIRFRVSDWQLISGAGPPVPLDPGPGPYIDTIRIGRATYSGPVVGSDFAGVDQAQDTFASDLTPLSGAEHYTPSTDRFGTCDFSRAREAPSGSVSNEWVKRGDSVFVAVRDVRGAGGITSIDLHGAIVAGPHAGKAPPPWSVGPNAFFTVAADTVRQSDGSVLEDNWFVDLDDDYFRGGDILLYFWSATDGAGGFGSYPDGLNALPLSVADAEAATNGLIEVSFLPAIDWDPGYLARIDADPHGKLEPTPAELANSRQRTCILYDQWVQHPRKSGQRTAFMYTLDRLGYSGLYDVYDHQDESGIYNTHLAGRATVEQATGYAVIVYDLGHVDSRALPLGGGRETWYPQTQWFQDWLAQAPTSLAGRATLWLLGEDVTQANSSNPLVMGEMGVTLMAPDQGLSQTPNVEGQTNFTWANGASTDFTGDVWNLNGGPGCPSTRDYDALGAAGSAVVTHRYKAGSIGDGAAIMNADPTTSSNTIMMSFWWEDVRSAQGLPQTPARDLASAILSAVLPESCQAVPDSTTGVPGNDEIDNLPRVTVLHANRPNPFNPTTTISFDLARTGHTVLRVYDVSGRLVRTLVNRPLERERHHVVWGGLDDAGTRVSSGLYLYRLTAGDFTATQKMVVLR